MSKKVGLPEVVTKHPLITATRLHRKPPNLPPKRGKKWGHGCTSCTYRGSLWNADQHLDVYTCRNGSYIARYGFECTDYESYIGSVLSQIRHSPIVQILLTLYRYDTAKVRNDSMGFAVTRTENNVVVLVNPLIDPRMIYYIDVAVRDVEEVFLFEVLTLETLHWLALEIANHVHYQQRECLARKRERKCK